MGECRHVLGDRVGGTSGKRLADMRAVGSLPGSHTAQVTAGPGSMPTRNDNTSNIFSESLMVLWVECVRSFGQRLRGVHRCRNQWGRPGRGEEEGQNAKGRPASQGEARGTVRQQKKCPNL